MRIFGILGYPLSHTLSPIMHRAAFEALGLKAIYAPFEVPPAQVGRLLRGLQVCGIDGLNVTVPHKERILRYLSPRHELTAQARAIGAVNTLVRRGRRFIGHNTDVEGFRRTLRDELKLRLQGARVLVLGAGGAARAVVWALTQDAPQAIIVANRTPARARQLVRWIRRYTSTSTTVEAMPRERRRMAAVMPSLDLLINATSLGLRPADPLPVDPAALHKSLAVVDLVYRAPTTALVRAARRRGALAVDGLPMLVYQGAESFRLWWNRPAPVAVMRRAVEAAVKRRRP